MRRPAPYVVRDPRWDNRIFFDRWAEVERLLKTATGAERDELLEELGAIQDHFNETAY